MPTADKNIRQAHDELMEAIESAETAAPCLSTDPEIFFSESSYRPYQQAIELCQTCPVMKLCGNFGLWHFQEYGVWGGTTPKQREQKRRSLGIRKRQDHPSDKLLV